MIPTSPSTATTTININGIHVFAAIRQGDGGPPLLLINGIGANLEVFDPFIDALEKIGRKKIGTIRFDVPGVGGSPPSLFPWRFRGFARLIAKLLDAMGHQEVDVLGISWGGVLAQQFAHQYPQRCRRLVLVATSTGAISVPGRPSVIVKLLSPRRYLQPSYLATIAPTLYGGIFRQRPDLARSYAHLLRAPHGLGYYQQLLAGVGWTSLPWLHRLRQPTLILAGNDDPVVPSVNARVMARLIPLLEPLADKLTSVRQYVVMGTPSSKATGKLSPVLDYEEFLSSAPEDFAWPRLDENAACAMCYTSGTTGNPKGVVYSHRSTYLHSLAATQADTMALSERDTLLPIVPMFHANAWGLAHAAPMVGARQVFPGRFMDPAKIASAIEAEHVTFAAGVPTIWIGLLQVLAKQHFDLSSLNRIICGGSAVTTSLIAGLQERGLRIVQAWGMTETSPFATISTIRPQFDHLSTKEQYPIRAKQGAPVPGVDLRVADLATGQEVPWDGKTSGEIQVRGPWIAAAYYHDDNSAAKFVDGWFRTGDVATIDEDGYVQIVDRTKDLVKSGGEWISSIELEGLIMGHPKVLEAAVIAVPHPVWQERPVACVVPKPECKDQITKDEIRDYLSARVAK